MNPEPEPIKYLKDKTNAEYYFLNETFLQNGSILTLHAHNLPDSGYVTLVSSGLEDYSGKEIIAHCKESELKECSEAFAVLIFEIANKLKKIKFGSTMGGLDSIPSIPEMTAFYFLEALYLENLPNDKYIWALPIYKNELDLILNKGPLSFNELIDDDETSDLLSINRKNK